MARTAAAYGAEVLTHVDAVAVGDGRATLRDENGEFTIECDHIITCTGVWTQELNPEIRAEPEPWHTSCGAAPNDWATRPPR